MTKTTRLANCVDLDEVAHHEHFHLDYILFALLSLNSQYGMAWNYHFVQNLLTKILQSAF